VAPEERLVFTKFPSCITGPVTTVTLPEGNVDWEIEVVAVIGRGGHRIPRAAAWDAVAGLTYGQDLPERLTQLRGKSARFSLGASFPGFGPIGPVAVTPDSFWTGTTSDSPRNSSRARRARRCSSGVPQK
jgi:2-keto-4-pentenoate hydratase/2-oxohepta-3-ene-1,7-dioic acid hydratase in catechol pathway